MTRLRRRLALLWAMSPGARRAFLFAFLALPVVALRLRLRGIAPFVHRMGAHAPPPARLSEAEVGAWAEAVNRAARCHFVAVSCLARSLVLKRLLDRRGISTCLRFGVRRTPEGLQAHAWLERAGRPLNDSPASVARFASLGDVPPLPGALVPRHE